MEKVFFIQKQLIKHESANFSAVRKMTEEDLGKRTAGVDKNARRNNGVSKKYTRG